VCGTDGTFAACVCARSDSGTAPEASTSDASEGGASFDATVEPEASDQPDVGSDVVLVDASADVSTTLSESGMDGMSETMVDGGSADSGGCTAVPPSTAQSVDGGCLITLASGQSFLGLIRFLGHFERGGYDGPDDGKRIDGRRGEETPSATA
jgi:hypothetical protein